MNRAQFLCRMAVLSLVMSMACAAHLLVAEVADTSGSARGGRPQCRGPNGAAVSTEKGLPAECTKDKNIRWKAPLPGKGLSNRVIAGGKVVVAASSGFQEHRLHVLCLDEASG